MPPILPSNIEAAAFRHCADTIAAAACELASRGWMPATSGNFSMRVDEGHAAITISGRDKGRLGSGDVMLIDMQGRAIGTDARPSAETGLHTQLYRLWPQVNTALHTHSRTQSVASRLFAREGVVRLEGWELQKAITGFDSHDSVLEIPVFPNTQYMPELESRVAAWLDAGRPLHAYLIDGHGLYAWGRDMTEARRHLEALDFLLGCELELRRLSA
jgi:methylthioribulose-1-phosphate dehydratase